MIPAVTLSCERLDRLNGWLLDTNVVAELAKPRGTVRVLAWAAAQDEALLFLGILDARRIR